MKKRIMPKNWHYLHTVINDTPLIKPCKAQVRATAMAAIRRIEPDVFTTSQRIKQMVEAGEQESAQFWTEYVETQRRKLEAYYESYRRNC